MRCSALSAASHAGVFGGETVTWGLFVVYDRVVEFAGLALLAVIVASMNAPVGPP
jgi:hypothetical protein